MVYEYESLIYEAEQEGGAYVIFPYDLRAVFGRGRVKAHLTFDGEPYEGSIVNMGVKNADGSICYIIGIRKDIRAKIRKQPGDKVRVTVQAAETETETRMWTCPECGRTFKKQNQDHYCGKAPETIDDYIAAQPEETRRYLHAVRDAIRRALPEAQERISWSMPTFWKRQNLIHFAAFKKHVGLYPGPEAVEAFKEQLKEYKTSKGAIQLPYSKPLPLELVGEIARWCYARADGE